MKNGKISNGSKILLTLSVIVALTLGFGVYTFFSQQYITVYLYNDSYETGSKISSDMFVSYQMKVDLFNAMAGTGNKYASADDISNFINSDDSLIVNVAQYTPVTVNQFVSTGGTRVENRLASNMVSVELPIGTVGGLSTDIRVGTRLNIMTGYSIDNMKETDMIFQNLLVVDKVVDANGELFAIYVEVDPAESIKLVHAIAFEKVTASIVKPNSYIAIPWGDSSFQRNYTSDMSRMQPSDVSMGLSEPASTEIEE